MDGGCLLAVGFKLNDGVNHRMARTPRGWEVKLMRGVGAIPSTCFLDQLS